MFSYFFYYISICTVHISKVDKILSTREVLFCSANLFGPRICGVIQLLVSTSRNSFTSLFLSRFSRLIFKSPVNITVLFPLENVLGVCIKYRKNSVSFSFWMSISILHQLQGFPCSCASFQSTVPHIHFENLSVSGRVLAL